MAKITPQQVAELETAVRALESACAKAGQDADVEMLAHRTAWRYKKSSDPHHSDTYTFNRETLLDFARKLRAIYSPAPAATAAVDERAEFEASDFYREYAVAGMPKDKQRLAFAAWQARAALAVVDERSVPDEETLTTWICQWRNEWSAMHEDDWLETDGIPDPDSFIAQKLLAALAKAEK